VAKLAGGVAVIRVGVEAEEKTQSGIVLPGTAAEKPDIGEVISVGPGKLLENGNVQELSVKTGDRVLFGKYSGQTVKVDGEEYNVVREEDILAIVE
jgi:chaperonin GroES